MSATPLYDFLGECSASALVIGALWRGVVRPVIKYLTKRREVMVTGIVEQVSLATDVKLQAQDERIQTKIDQGLACQDDRFEKKLNEALQPINHELSFNSGGSVKDAVHKLPTQLAEFRAEIVVHQSATKVAVETLASSLSTLNKTTDKLDERVDGVEGRLDILEK